jgi:3-oxo-5-alpha-steroid 4-dehydrogenase 1
VQWLQLLRLLPPWYGMGKSSVASRLNLPGRLAWATMEAPGALLLAYIMCTLPAQLGVTLPRENWLMAGVYVSSPSRRVASSSPADRPCLHYTYRAIIYPLAAPSMSPIHAAVWLGALCFQLLNATCIGGWLGGPRFLPGRVFLVNEIATMLPRALDGRRWYLDRFGGAVAGRRAVLPGIL